MYITRYFMPLLDLHKVRQKKSDSRSVNSSKKFVRTRRSTAFHLPTEVRTSREFMGIEKKIIR